MSIRLILSIPIIAFLNNNCFLSGTATHVLFLNQLYLAHVHTHTAVMYVDVGENRNVLESLALSFVS